MVLVQQVPLALPPGQHVQLTGLLVEMDQPCNQLQWQDKCSRVEDLRERVYREKHVC